MKVASTVLAVRDGCGTESEVIAWVAEGTQVIVEEVVNTSGKECEQWAISYFPTQDLDGCVCLKHLKGESNGNGGSRP